MLHTLPFSTCLTAQYSSLWAHYDCPCWKLFNTLLLGNTLRSCPLSPQHSVYSCKAGPLITLVVVLWLYYYYYYYSFCLLFIIIIIIILFVYCLFQFMYLVSIFLQALLRVIWSYASSLTMSSLYPPLWSMYTTFGPIFSPLFVTYSAV